MKNSRVKNIRSISVRNEGLNSRVERLNGTMRDREKVMRDMHSKESAQKIIEAMRIHYNYCRELSRKDSSRTSWYQVRLGRKQDFESLIRMASINESDKSK
jgi:transposase-like protein